MPQNTPQVFICYSRKDNQALETLKTFLAPFTREQHLKTWDDQSTRTGDKWRDEIRDAMERAEVAVLLVSADFLASDFIYKNELPPLMEKARNGKLRVVWVPLSHCAYEHTPIVHYQAAWNPETPLDGLKKGARSKAWAQIAEEVNKAARLKPTGNPGTPQPSVISHAKKKIETLPKNPRPDEETSISWLHLANPGFGATGFRDRVLSKLPAAIIEKTDIRPDLVFFSGIADEGKNAHYEQAREKLSRLARDLGHDPTRHWFIVPGPNDVNETLITPIHQIIRSGLNLDDLYASLEDGQVWQTLSQRLTPFYRFIESFQGPDKAPSPSQPWRVGVYEKNGHKLAVLCLNLVWSAALGQHKDLLLSEQQLERALQTAANQEGQLKLALCGPGLASLVRSEQSIAEGLLQGRDGCHFMLWGDPTTINLSQTNQVGAGCVSMGTGPCSPQVKTPTALLVRVYPGSGQGEVHALEFSPDKGGFWRKAEVYSGMDGGVWHFTLPTAGTHSAPKHEAECSPDGVPGPTSSNETAPDFLHNVPVLALDLADFSRYKGTQKRPVLEHLQKIMKAAAALVEPATGVRDGWIQHGTGDGYYLFLREASAGTAGDYAMALATELEAHNQQFPSLPMFLRMVLAVGNVDRVGDQWEGEVLIQAARFLDHPRFKDYLRRARAQGIPCVLAASSEFHMEAALDANQPWTSFEIKDKHGFPHHGHVWDHGCWEEPPDAGRLAEDAVGSELEVAHEVLEDMKARGEDTSAQEETILHIKRRLREGGCLARGDMLSGRYSLLEEAGRGGFGVVWKAWDKQQKRTVAAKVLHGQFSKGGTHLERFFRGARKMAELDHPGIVRVFDRKCMDGGYAYFIMEYLAGGDFGQAVKLGTYNTETLLKWILTIGEALAFAHEAGMVHRDIKPGNIMLDGQGRACLTDFDLVGGKDTTGGTRTQAGLGSFIYAAPEQMSDAAKAGPMCDIYGLGMSTLFAVYGDDLPPHVLRDVRVILDGLKISQRLKSVIEQATSWDLKVRHQTVQAFYDDLEACLKEGIGPPNPPPEPTIKSEDNPPTPLPSEPKPLRKGAWIKIPAGTFTMGAKGLSAAVPPHQVTLTNDFLIGKYPVTNEEYRGFIDADGYKEQRWWDQKGWDWREKNGILCPRDRGVDFNDLRAPVICVSWFEATAYCRWLTEQLKEERPDWEVRLPTEAQWEYAARGLEGRTFPWGKESPDEKRANYSRKVGYTSPVGAYPKGQTPEGVCDMAGNVWEWCLDHWDMKAYKNRKMGAGDPCVVSDSSGRALRGGSWNDDRGYLRSADRLWFDADHRDLFIGFRCVWLCVAVPSTGH